MSRVDDILSTLSETVRSHLAMTAQHNPSADKVGATYAALAAAVATELDAIHRRIDELESP